MFRLEKYINKEFNQTELIEVVQSSLYLKYVYEKGNCIYFEDWRGSLYWLNFEIINSKEKIIKILNYDYAIKGLTFVGFLSKM